MQLWRSMTAKELYTVIHGLRRTIRVQAALLILLTLIIGSCAWRAYDNRRIIATQDTLIKTQELRIINLVGRVQELEQAKESESISTSRGGERMPLIKWNVDEVKAMAKVVHAEARGENQFGKMMVARVIMNRVEVNPGMTVDEIINRPNAFAQSREFDEYDLHAVFEAAIEPRYRDVFTFFNPDTATNREFVASKMPDAVLKVGSHVFCR